MHLKAPSRGMSGGDDSYPRYSLRFLVPGYSPPDHDDAANLALLDALWRRSGMTWSELRSAPRAGLGYEQMPGSRLNEPIPRTLSPDVQTFISFRMGRRGRMIGYRVIDTFHAVWCDPLHKVYDG